MKIHHFLTLLCTFLPLTTTALTNSTPLSLLGPCYKRCVTKFGETKEQLTNAETISLEYDVSNNTEFSLCKLGCNSHEYTDLNLAAFRYGQLAYQKILTTVEDVPTRGTVLNDVFIVCLDTSFMPSNNSAPSAKRLLSGTVLLVLDEDVAKADNVFLIEVLARNADKSAVQVISQQWCYSSNCNITFNAPTEVSSFDVRLRVSTFDSNGQVGGINFSKWHNINQILTKTFVDMSLKSVVWKAEKAAANFVFNLTASDHVPACSLQMIYRSSLSSELLHRNFYLDHTLEVFVNNLDFDKIYTMQLAPSGTHDRSTPSLASAVIEIPPCRHLVDDYSMCAPPPVSSLSYNWNLSPTSEYELLIKWKLLNYMDGLNVTEELSIPVAYFLLNAHPLITANNEQCEKYEKIRRVVSYGLRELVFHVPDTDCNYEVEMTAVDTNQRISEVKKIQVFRFNVPPYVSFLQASDIPTSVELMAVVLATSAIFALIALFLLYRKRKRDKKARFQMYKDAEAGVSYDYVATTESLGSVVQIRSTNFRFEPVENIDGNIEAALAQQQKFEGGTMNSMFRTYYNLDHPVKVPAHMAEASSDEDNGYENIRYSYFGSELSDDVFEEDIYMTHKSLSIYCQDSPLTTPMAPIAPYEHFDDIPSHQYRNFQVHNFNERIEKQAYWLMATVVDVVRRELYSLKVPKDYTPETISAMRKELEFLRTLAPHGNCRRFEGVVIGRWDDLPRQVIGILIENTRGGTLRNYIAAVGSVFRNCSLATDHDSFASQQDMNSTQHPFDKLSTEADENNSKKVKIQEITDSLSIRFCQFAEQVSSALEHLHSAGSVHTRVTTLNIYLLHNYSDPFDMLPDQVVKLGNFGFAVQNSEDVVLDDNLQPPEVIKGEKYEARGDIWQFGLCLAEMCSLGDLEQSEVGTLKSGHDTFKNLPSTQVLRDAAKRCLSARTRPSASDLCGVFKSVNVAATV